jgi:hypothetical protein
MPCLRIPADRDCYGFDEWFIFDEHPAVLGTLSDANPFTTEIAHGSVFAFINLGGFSLSDPGMRAVADLFWRQVDWIKPHSYLGDGENHLIYATQDEDLFAAVKESLHHVE